MEFFSCSNHYKYFYDLESFLQQINKLVISTNWIMNNFKTTTKNLVLFSFLFFLYPVFILIILFYKFHHPAIGLNKH